MKNDDSPDGAATLDPADWEAFRALAHRMVDDMVENLASVRERPVWRPVPAETRARIAGPLPEDGEGADAAYEAFRRDVLAYPLGNGHPRFWGWVIGNGTPLGMLADMLSAGLNSPSTGYDQSAFLVENQVVTWLAELMGMPAGTSGLLVSGGSMANVIALTAARNAKAPFDVRRDGLQSRGGAARPELVFYGSTETHSWAIKAADLLGLGDASFRRIAVNAAYEIDVAALRAAIAADRAAGRRPFCAIGTAGTVNTGATDDLLALADLCAAEGLWFHVDGAFGAWAAAVPSLAPLVRGMERADSLAFDLHKWGYLPYELGCVLVRSGEDHARPFRVQSSYLKRAHRGPISEGLPYADLGPQLSRGFKALKVWMSFKAHGVSTYRRLVARNVAQARRLGALVEAHPSLELLAPVSLNVVCFRFVAPGLSGEELNEVNEEILLRIQESGLAVPSGTSLGGRFAIRVANTNYRSRDEDFDLLVKGVVETGEALLAERAAPAGQAARSST